MLEILRVAVGEKLTNCHNSTCCRGIEDVRSEGRGRVSNYSDKGTEAGEGEHH